LAGGLWGRGHKSWSWWQRPEWWTVSAFSKALKVRLECESCTKTLRNSSATFILNFWTSKDDLHVWEYHLTWACLWPLEKHRSWVWSIRICWANPFIETTEIRVCERLTIFPLEVLYSRKTVLTFSPTRSIGSSRVMLVSSQCWS
jgi:hypothetical protein